jgi:HlyD family secretion protein
LGKVLAWLLLFSAIVTLVVFGVARVGTSGRDREAEALTHVAAKGVLNVTVTERGNLESQKTTDGTCELHGHENKIIFIAEEGSQVAKDEVVVRFDSSQLDKSIAEEEIQVNQAQGEVDSKRQELSVQINQNESDIAAAELELKLARLDLKKYREGDYLVKQNEMKGQIALAESDLQKAKTTYDHLSQLVKSGFREPEQLQAAYQDVQYKQFYLQRAQGQLGVLENFEYERSLTEFESKAREAERKVARALASAEAQKRKFEAALASAEATLRLKEKRLEEFNDQKSKCEIKASQPGIVAYANKEYWDESRRIREGAIVHERQVIFHLPDMSSMQVKVNVHESVVKKVKPNQKAIIRVDAFPNLAIQGTIKKVSPLADSSNFWSSGGVKEYTTYVTVDSMPSEELRPGMTAEVEIQVGKYPDVLLVPVQAVTQKGRTHYAFRQNGEDAYEAREIQVGESNSKYIQIKSGLAEGDRIALDARIRALKLFGKDASDVDEEKGTEEEKTKEDPAQGLTEAPESGNAIQAEPVVMATPTAAAPLTVPSP